MLGVLTAVEYLRRPAAILSAISFGVALLAESYMFKMRPDRVWYDGRAGAESAKTLSWRFMVGGAPFPKTLSDADAEALLLNRLRDVVSSLEGIALVPLATPPEQVTPTMRRLRGESFERRRTAYLDARIHEQRDWYADNARWNEKQATRWTIALGLGEAAALAGAILTASGAIKVDMMGVAASGVAAGAAWIQTKQYQTLAAAYAVATHELADISARAGSVADETAWANFVDQSEEAISREHTLWRASRN